MKYNMTIRIYSILAVFGILNAFPLFATEEKDPLTDQVPIPEVVLSAELADLKSEVTAPELEKPLAVATGSEFGRVFTGAGDAPFRLELDKCEIFRNGGNGASGDDAEQWGCRISVSLLGGDGSKTTLSSTGKSLNVNDDAVRMALDEAIASLADKVRRHIQSDEAPTE